MSKESSLCLSSSTLIPSPPTVQHILHQPGVVVLGGLGETTISSPLNARLPFDVLSRVFEYYALTEAPSYPLETLLLICKFWHQVVCDHTRLWTKFTMHVTHPSVWCIRVPRRLRRCSPDSLLDIEILVKNNISEEGKASTANTYLSLLESLAGANGEVARRWQRLTFHDTNIKDRGPNLQSRLEKVLAFATPNLEELSLIGVVSPLSIFPKTPALKNFYAYNTHLHSFPDISTVTYLAARLEDNDQNLLTNAASLTRLDVLWGSRFQSSPKITHPQLMTLYISGLTYIATFAAFSAPNLTRLHVSFVWSRQFEAIRTCKEVLQNVRELGLAYDDLGYLTRSEYVSSIRRFLPCMTNIEILILYDSFIAGIILKLLLGECKSLYQERPTSLKLYSHEIRLEPGELRRSSVDKLRELQRDIPDGTWNEIFGLIKDPDYRRPINGWVMLPPLR